METPTREVTFSKALKIIPLAPPFIVMGPRDMKVLDLLEVYSSAGQAHPALLVEVDERAPTGHRHTFSVIGVGHAVPDHCETYIGYVKMEEKYLIAVYKDKEDAFDDNSKGH